MGLIINHNMMAMTAARNLSTTYSKLATSTQRLSSGLRINSAADDAAGLAVRELMRADISVLNQGLRNASDAVSMIQTADGALSVIDEKLTRMKELAEQASTGTYTTAQRDIMNSEYQAMAKEIDRISNATDFNGIKLLDGSVSTQHGSQGLKIHFGTGNNSSEDYYFINMGDARATAASGLKVGGDAKNDVWGQAGTGAATGGGCCGAGYHSLSSAVVSSSGKVFAYGYNWDLNAATKGDVEGNMSTPKYIGGMYQFASGATMQNIIDQVNAGSQSRIKIEFANVQASAMAVQSSASVRNSLAERVCVGNEVYYWGSASLATVGGKDLVKSLSNTGSATAAAVVANAINTSSKNFWAITSGTNVYVFKKLGGDFNSLVGCDEQVGAAVGSATIMNRVKWRNVETNLLSNSGNSFTLGGNQWGTFKPAQTAAGTYALTLNGMQVGDQRDLWVMNVGSGTAVAMDLPSSTSATGSAYGLHGAQLKSNLTGFSHADFTELQNAANGSWAGAEIRTQSSAQESLDALGTAIIKKDKIRADLGALQNRLQNTMTNLSIQAENLQAAESRISDVDVAVEMTTFTKNNILAQAGTAMLAQSNSLANLALSLLGR